MSIEDRIYEWLHGYHNYKQGLTLYEAVPHNQRLVFLFRKQGRTPYTLGKLYEELNNYLHSIRYTPAIYKERKLPLFQETEVEPDTITYLPIYSKSPAPTAKEIPSYEKHLKKLKELKKEAVRKLRERDGLRAQLLLLDNDETRYSAAVRILNLNDKIDGIYIEVDHYKNYQNSDKEKVERIADLKRRRNNLRSYISTARKELDHANLTNDTKRIETATANLKKKLDEREAIKSALAELAELNA